jgi:hypothetical protein
MQRATSSAHAELLRLLPLLLSARLLRASCSSASSSARSSVTVNSACSLLFPQS